MRVTIGAANHDYATSQPDKCKTAWKFLKDVPRYMNGLVDMDEFSPKLLSLRCLHVISHSDRGDNYSHDGLCQI